MATYKIKKKEDIGVSFPNLFDLGSNFNLILLSAFLQITQDAR